MFSQKLICFLLLSALISSCKSATNSWLTLPNSSLEPDAGSALDLSQITSYRNPDNTSAQEIVVDGEHFVSLVNNKNKVRFFTATLSLSPNNNGFPTHAESDRLAAMIKRRGYNAVRVHFVEAMLMDKQTIDFGFNSEQLDRFYYLISALRAQGMYFFVDMLGSWNGAYGDVKGHRWTRGQHDVVLGSLLPGSDRDHWLKLVKALWLKENPYTKLPTLLDPAVAGVVLVNEGDLDHLLRGGPNYELLSPFKDWLLKKYKSQQGLMRSTNVDVSNLKLPSINEKSSIAADFQQFASELQIDQIEWMKSQLAQLGYKGLVTALDTYPSYHNAASRAKLSFVDMHQYADGIDGGMIEPGTKLNSAKWPGRLLDGKSRYLDKLAWSRQFGQPFTVTEYGQPFWNKYRWEVAPLTAAYASLQDWSLIAHFGNVFSLSRPASGNWRQMMVPYEIGTDPTLLAGETMAAFLFGRGDVTASKSKLMLNIKSAEVDGLAADRFVPWSLAQSQYILGVGINVDSSATETAQTGQLSLSEDQLSFQQIYQRLLEAKVISLNDVTSAKLQRYQSTTGELVFDASTQSMTVNTKGSIAVLGSSGSKVKGSFASITVDKGEGAFMLADLGVGDLSKSKRALLIMSTDSRNTGMTFLDSDEKVLGKIGTFPALIKDASITLELGPASNGKRWRLFALSFNGKRTKELSLVKQVNGGVVAKVSLDSQKNTGTPYWEFLAE